MTLDDILLEWSYRLPKGYPTVVDGQFVDQKELRILHEVMGEYGVVDVSLLNARNESTLREEERTETSFSKEDLIGIIQNAQLSERDLVRITRIVDAASTEEGIIERLSTQKNFDETSALQVFRMATESGDYKQLRSMLDDPAKQIDVDSLPQTGNIVEIVKSTGVSKQFAKDMANMVPYTSVKMGRYEMFLRLFLRGGKSPTAKGDVEVNGEEMEVKSTISKGSGFRLRGNSGYGNGKQVQLSFMKQLVEVYGVGGPSHGGSQNIPQHILEAYKEQNGQMWLKKKDPWAVLANRDLIETNLKTKEEVVLMWGTALAELYPDSTPESIGKFIGPSFGNDGSIDMKDVETRLAAYEFTIYRQREGFNYFIGLNYQDNYGFILPETKGEALVETFKSVFKVVSLPNTKNSSNPQDSMCAIELA